MRLSKLIGIPLCVAMMSSAALAAPSPSPSPSPTPSPSPSPSPSPTPIEEKSPLTTVTENKEKGKLVADSIGKTLYVFDLDQKRTKPACIGNCVEIWPPYLINDKEAVGLKTPLGTIKRISKKLQLTYNGRPVYTYAFDRVQGDQFGNGVGGTWHVIEAK